jgi:hypothetical protein
VITSIESSTIIALVVFIALRFVFGLIFAGLIADLEPEVSGSEPRRYFSQTSIPVGIHKSMTTSPIGREQQTRRFPSAGMSSGFGS